MSVFAENLKKFRKLNDYSLDELVNRLNSKYQLSFTKTTMARWESGDTSPSIDHASAIAEFFGVGLDEMTKNKELKPKWLNDKKIQTIAAHIDDDVTDEELEVISTYIEFLKSQRK